MLHIPCSIPFLNKYYLSVIMQNLHINSRSLPESTNLSVLHSLKETVKDKWEDVAQEYIYRKRRGQKQNLLRRKLTKRGRKILFVFPALKQTVNRKWGDVAQKRYIKERRKAKTRSAQKKAFEERQITQERNFKKVLSIKEKENKMQAERRRQQNGEAIALVRADEYEIQVM